MQQFVQFAKYCNTYNPITINCKKIEFNQEFVPQCYSIYSPLLMINKRNQ